MAPGRHRRVSVAARQAVQQAAQEDVMTEDVMTPASVANSFAVDAVSVPGEALPSEKAKASVERLLGTRVEACDSYSADVVAQPGFHSLIAAAHLAYEHHYPL